MCRAFMDASNTIRPQTCTFSPKLMQGFEIFRTTIPSFPDEMKFGAVSFWIFIAIHLGRKWWMRVVMYVRIFVSVMYCSIHLAPYSPYFPRRTSLECVCHQDKTCIQRKRNMWHDSFRCLFSNSFPEFHEKHLCNILPPPCFTKDNVLC